MQADLITIGLGFLEGLALIVSPCILPILPIILAGSLTGSKKRPLGIIVGFILVFSLFTFFSRQLVQYSGIDLNLIRHVSYGVLLLLGVIMLSSTLTEKFNLMTNSLMNIGSSFSSANNSEGGWFSGVLFGGLTAIIWTPCAGPILAAVIVQTVIQQSNAMGLMTLLAFGTGAAVPMLIIALFGREIVSRFGFFKNHASLFRKLLGLIVILSVAFMISLENGINLLPVEASQATSITHLENGLTTPYPAPELVGLDHWINSPPLTLNELRGKVVLIDFWTYSCINCIRTLPYLKAWYAKYHDKGLVIIGIHAPEFDFEKDFQNVSRAVTQDGIKYPVALDNHFQTWQNYHNRYWPAHYLIDKNGSVVYTHFGEGEYDTTENNIRYLLNDSSKTNTTVIPQDQPSYNQTPETYLGYARADYFKSDTPALRDQAKIYHFPKTLAQNEWALQGKWTMHADRITSENNTASLKIHFYANHVYIVMGNATNTPIPVTLLLNGKKVEADKGSDVLNSQIIVSGHRLYDVIALTQPTQGVLEIIPGAAGLEMYTFTF